MKAFSRIVLSSLLGIGLLGGPGAPLAQTADDPFYNWEVERYRLSRSPDDPSGGILPIPSEYPTSRPVAMTASLRVVGTNLDAYGIDEEADGLFLPDGWSPRLQTVGTIPLPLGFHARLGGRMWLDNENEAHGDWLERAIVWKGNRTEITAGITRQFWGDAGEGSLLLGRTAPPFDMLRVRSVHPWHIPFLSGPVSRLHGSFFLGYLNDRYRPVPFPLLHGERVEWEPLDWFRLSLARTMMFGGGGRTEKFNAGDVVDVLLARNDNHVDATDYSNSDQKASIGVELRMPPPLARKRTRGLIDGGRIYYEYAGEDGPHPIIPRAPAHAYGFSLSRHGWIGLLEMADTMNRDNHFYTHWIYGPYAYSYRGFNLGHPMGSMAWSRHLRIFSPEWSGTGFQSWVRFRGYQDDLGKMARVASLGLRLIHTLPTGEMVEAELEGYRYRHPGSGIYFVDGFAAHGDMTTRLRAQIGLRIGSTSPSGSP